MTLEFCWDIASPYTYVAYTQLPGLVERTGCSIRMLPVLLGGIFKDAGNTMPGAVPAKAAYMTKDLGRLRDHFGIPLKLPVAELPFPIRSVLPMRVAVVAETQGKSAAFTDMLMKTYWADGEDVSQPAILQKVAQAAHLSEDALAQAETTEVKDTLRTHTRNAVERGAFGVPTFFVGGEMFFGGDRMPFVERALSGATDGRTS
ncbi:MAG: 2-hydroxychromene-2-carboxylate isomerase [Myxococcota bacterium]